MTSLEAALETAIDYRRRISEAQSRSERLRVLSYAPLFSLWDDVRRELQEAAEEIERLERRVRSLEGEDA